VSHENRKIGSPLRDPQLWSRLLHTYMPDKILVVGCTIPLSSLVSDLEVHIKVKRVRLYEPQLVRQSREGISG
jgi:hypothetical protein